MLRSCICWRCCNWAADGTCDVDGGALDGGAGEPHWFGGSDCLRRRLNAGLRLYVILAWTRSSLKIYLIFESRIQIFLISLWRAKVLRNITCVTFSLFFAEASTKPFSQSTFTKDSVVSKSSFMKEYNNSIFRISWNVLRKVGCIRAFFKFGRKLKFQQAFKAFHFDKLCHEM